MIAGVVICQRRCGIYCKEALILVVVVVKIFNFALRNAVEPHNGRCAIISSSIVGVCVGRIRASLLLKSFVCVRSNNNVKARILDEASLPLIWLYDPL